jgi:hypothetical protein
VRAVTATWWCALAVVVARASCAADTGPPSTDTRFASYAFASELGSGVYEISGSTITVYTFEPDYQLRSAQPRGGRPGIKLLLPTTVGFFNFQTSDLLHLELPSSIGTLSLEPGVELDYWITDAWDVYPYAKAGATFASSSAINAFIYGTGVRSDYRYEALGGWGLWRAELNYAAVHYKGDLPNESFTRLRNGAELRHNVGTVFHSRKMQLSPYLVTDIYFNAPEGPASGIAARTVQFEVGLMLNVTPNWVIHGIPLPRLGLGYREAGVLSGWRLVLGEPF